jgi:hypothetical protein
MSTLDLYEEGFPHGSAAGYDLGCRGIACPNHGSAELLSCREAKTKHQSDYATGKLPDDTVLEREHPEPVARVQAKKNVTRQLRTTRGPLPVASIEPVAAPAQLADVEVPVDASADPHDEMTEKQRRGHYATGCRDPRCRAAASAAARSRTLAREAAAGPVKPPVKVARHSFQGKPKKPTKPSAEVLTTPAVQSDDTVVDTAAEPTFAWDDDPAWSGSTRVAGTPLVVERNGHTVEVFENGVDTVLPFLAICSCKRQWVHRSTELAMAAAEKHLITTDKPSPADELAHAEQAARELQIQVTRLTLQLEEEQHAHMSTRAALAAERETSGELQAAIARSIRHNLDAPAVLSRGGIHVRIDQAPAGGLTLTLSMDPQ